MSTMVKDETYGGFVDGTPVSSDFYLVSRVSASLGMVVDMSTGKRRATGVVVPLASSWVYVTPASGVEGGWKQVFTTPPN